VELNISRIENTLEGQTGGYSVGNELPFIVRTVLLRMSTLC